MNIYRYYWLYLVRGIWYDTRPEHRFLRSIFLLVVRKQASTFDIGSFIMQDFFGLKKWSLFAEGKKTESCATQNGAASSQIFWNSSLTLRIIKARGCKRRFKSDLLAWIYMQYYYTVVYHVRPTAAVRHRGRTMRWM